MSTSLKKNAWDIRWDEKLITKEIKSCQLANDESIYEVNYKENTFEFTNGNLDPYLAIFLVVIPRVLLL